MTFIFQGYCIFCFIYSVWYLGTRCRTEGHRELRNLWE